MADKNYLRIEENKMTATTGAMLTTVIQKKSSSILNRKEPNMKSYQSIQDARINHPDMGKYDYETVLINNEPTVLCGTTLVQEELFEAPLTKMFKQLA